MPLFPTRPGSPFEPLGHPAYLRLWLGLLCLNLGLWMQMVTAGWLMVSLGGTPLQVGLIQTASALPSFLFALPGGVIADLVDRRRLLLAAQGAVAAVAVAMAALSGGGLLAPIALLCLTFAYGLGNAIQGPAWFTSQQDVLPPASRLAAMSLGGVSYSCARAVGPALAGTLMLWLSPAAVFGIVAALGLLSVALVRRGVDIPRQRPHGTPHEGFSAALVNALRYARTNRPLQIQLLRTLAFVLSGAALWALLPLLARGHADQAGRYGLSLGCMGAGAVVGALTLPLAHTRMSRARIDASGSVVFLVVTLAAPFVDATLPLVPLYVAAGIGWSWVGTLGMTTLIAQAERHLQARALALYLIAFQGAMALGGALWGQLAGTFGVRATLCAGAASVGVSMLVSRGLPWPAIKLVEEEVHFPAAQPADASA